MKKLTNSILASVILAMLLIVGVQAASIDDVYLTPGPPGGQGATPPGEATSNSIFTIHFTWRESESGKLPEDGFLWIGTYVPYEGFTYFIFPAAAGKGNPMSDEGRLYEFRMTAGLNLTQTNPLENALPGYALYWGAINYDHPIPDLRDVYYMPGLTANDPASAMKVYVTALYQPDKPPDSPPEDPIPEPQVVGPVSADVIVHDSHRRPHIAGDLNSRWAGVRYDRDVLHNYVNYDGGYPRNWPKPIQSFGLDENFQWREPDIGSGAGSDLTPDDGTTSTCWEFRVVYRNSDNLPPIPYVPYHGGALGDDYMPWFGYNDEPANTGVLLYLKNKSWDPDQDFVTVHMRKVDDANNDYRGGVEYFCMVEPAGWLNDYVGLPIGEYEYFFACSDDNIRTLGGDIPTWLDYELVLSDPLELLPKMAVTGPPLEYTSNGDYLWSWLGAYNTGLYLDRPTLQPGVTDVYEYPADEHPVVTLGLRQPSIVDSPWESTVSPFYEIINPQTTHVQVGGAQNQKWDFRIKYQHLYGLLPEQSQGAGREISVWINNSNQIVPSPATPATQYTRYTLVLERPNPNSPPPTAGEIKDGVIYHLPNPIELAPGPHSYFFTTSDGLKRARYPVDGHGHYYTGDHAFEGPYVNHKPVLSDPRVDPPTGTAGDNFRYSILYKDADNQRPYSAKIYIEYADGQVLVGEMIKENPADSDYDGVGVKYIFDTANMAQQFQEGQRRFYFEFVDNWGAVAEPRDNRRGEAVYYNSARPESWIYGPYINRNAIPQLIDGSVIATDGANNSATQFEYKVRYVDLDNHAPKYLDVFIGQEQQDGTITWDNGHRLDPVDANDVVYSGDGVWFHYYSQLTGDGDGKNYYYCFVASDRYDVAEYDASKSPSAGTVWFTRQADGSPLFKGERQFAPDPNDPAFTMLHKPLVGPIEDSPTESSYRDPMLFDAAGNEVGFTRIDYVNGIGYADPVMPVGFIQYWFATPGPTGVGLNTPPTLTGGSVSPDPGESTAEYTYRVTYTDLDGTMGQPPYFIRVRIDGVPFDMIRAAGGEPNYKNGVTYYYRTTALTPQLPHHYYFEASDGSGFSVLDKTGSRSSDQPIGAITWIPGPYVNNKPTLTAPATGAVYPAPGTPISTSQWLNFGIVYTDANNEPPTTGTPVVYIRKVNPLIPPVIPPPPAPEPLNDFKVQSVSGAVLTVVKLDGSNPNWTLDEFKGLPVQFTTGTASGTSYRVSANTANTLTLLAQTLPGVAANNAFSIGKIQLNKDVNGLYSYRLNSLGEGDYAVHFMSSTEELIGEGGLKRTTVLRYPAIGEITGLKITSTAPAGNQAPVLSKATNSALVDPQLGLAGDLFTFKITYSDANGDAPIFRAGEFVTGYVKLIVDGVLPGIEMTGPASPNYVTGAEFSAVVDSANPVLTPGRHTFYFEGSDGWVIGRYPALGFPDPEFYINRKPVLTSPAVTPIYGNAGMDYEFTVTYQDADNRVPDPVLGSVLVWINGTSHPMTLDTASGTDFVAGVRYHVTIPGSSLIVGAADANSFYCTANDGLEDAVQTATITGPHVHPNTAPQLSVGMVNPTDRWTDTTYTYSVIYSDDEGDLPEYVELDIFINGAGAPLTFDMQKVANQNNFEAGVTYTYDKQGLPVGTHTYAFRTKDFELDNAVPSTGTGPNVSLRPTSTLQVNQPASTPRIGYAVTLTGSISPAMSVPLTLTFKRPDDSQFTRIVNTAANGTFSTQWTPDMTGMRPGPCWNVKAAWAGNADYATAESAWRSIDVTGPSSTVKGLDMISIPIDPANGFPGAVFGDGSYAIAQYRPLQNDYAYYRSVPGLPGSPDLPLSDIVLGGGYWFKVYGGSVMTMSPSGDMAPYMANYEIHLVPGWNQIGCPFNGSVDWSTLKVRRGNETLDIGAAAGRGWIRSYGWAFEQSTSDIYTGEYRLVDPTRNGALTTLEPWRGYWVKAMQDCYLIVPPPGTLAMEAVKPLSIETTKGSGWDVKLSASVGSKADTDNSLGSAVTSSKIESPGYMDNFVDLYFTDEKGGVYASDVRSNVSNKETWVFKVTTDQSDGLMQLSWDGVESLPIGSTLTLVDEATGQSIVMKPGGVFTFPAAQAAGGRLFRAILGAK